MTTASTSFAQVAPAYLDRDLDPKKFEEDVEVIGPSLPPKSQLVIKYDGTEIARENFYTFQPGDLSKAIAKGTLFAAQLQAAIDQHLPVRMSNSSTKGYVWISPAKHAAITPAVADAMKQEIENLRAEVEALKKSCVKPSSASHLPEKSDSSH